MRRAAWLCVSIVIIAAALLLAGYGFLRASAPQLDGARRLTGLTAPVTIMRDALGVPSIKAEQRMDVARALGFLHAQDRFFQMDLLRRLPAGELSALVGAAALESDRAHRLYRLRMVARQVVAEASPARRELLEAYADGVNAGLDALTAMPFEYGILMQMPQRWLPEDSVLVSYAMYFDLQDESARHDSNMAALRDCMPAPLFEFLTAPGSAWDTPVQGPPFATPPVPGPEVLDLRAHPAGISTPDPIPEPGGNESAAGSNSWAVGAAHGANGRAILANDMHLPLGLPNIWYRAQWTYPGTAGPGAAVRVTGITLPGLPVMVAGSNGHVAWGFTNSYGDWSDLVLLHVNPDDPGQYRTAQGWRRFDHYDEVIHVKGGADVDSGVTGTVWGPLVDAAPDGTLRAVHWAGLVPEATNLELEAMERARDVHEAVEIANRAGLPAQNFISADADGNIAWTIAGRIPVRSGYDPRFPAYWDEPGVGWTGWLAPSDYPRIINPPDGRLWSANARMVDGGSLALIGDSGYDLGARARQIRDSLMQSDQFTPADMLAIQLDDRALFLSRWRTLLLQILDAGAVSGNAARMEFRRLVEHWDGHASVSSAGYRLVRGFRRRVQEAVLAPLFATCPEHEDPVEFTDLARREAPLWALVTARPPNLLDPAYKNWDALLVAAVDREIEQLGYPGRTLAERTWGERNTIHMRHPLSGAVPLLSRILDIAPVQLPGDHNMPRVQDMEFGASQRMVVEPGNEQAGIFEMPGGQSGWPLSPYYRNSEPAWETGAASPFLPGAPEHTLLLQPAN